MAVNREDDGDDLIASTVERVRRWLAEAEFDERRLERRTAEQLHRLTGDTAGILDLGTMHPDSWAEWIDYLRLAAAHNGFRNS